MDSASRTYSSIAPRMYASNSSREVRPLVRTQSLHPRPPAQFQEIPYLASYVLSKPLPETFYLYPEPVKRPATRVARRSKKYVTPRWNPISSPIIDIPYTPKPVSKPDNIKKVYVQKACINCKSSHVACDTSRPCLRCIRNGKSSSCIDATRKRRGRPSSKQLSSTDDSDTSIESPTKSSPITQFDYKDETSINDPTISGSTCQKASLRSILLYPADLDRKPTFPEV
ncbi:hypothetical protein K7432_003830 [Basidiobolus ranarum]|uniref:Zn(2)-C6 fungal-type domain-containing protein n=1 Tax=Basidiobolus ranarum TaxID=34480 RepID=A0ABR2WZA7_9FUNG